jgi:adenylate cyclase
MIAANDGEVEASPAAPSLILVVDDVPANVRLLESLLRGAGYRTISAHNGTDALNRVKDDAPDLVLLDIVMPGLSGIDVCRELRRDPHYLMLPIVLVTALDPEQERVKGLAAGADDFLSKPVNTEELLARVRSSLRIKALYDQVQAQAKQLERWNQALSARVNEQVAELERLSRLKRFLPEQVANSLLLTNGEATLASHRREITVVYLDLRGFTTFAEQAEPEDVMGALAEYHHEMGTLAMGAGGTLERFTGDAIMVFFNDPVPMNDHPAVAASMAVAMRQAASTLTQRWQRRGFTLGIGIGIASGYATLGTVGFHARHDYAAIGSVTNLACRLCNEAKANEVLIAERVFGAIEQRAIVEPLGLLALRGFAREQSVYRLIALADDTRVKGETTA